MGLVRRTNHPLRALKAGGRRAVWREPRRDRRCVCAAQFDFIVVRHAGSVPFLVLSRIIAGRAVRSCLDAVPQLALAKSRDARVRT